MTQGFQVEAEQAAVWLRRQAVIVSVLTGVGLVLAPWLAHGSASATLVLMLAVVPALLALALSGLLAFDAALFRLMAAQADEESAARVVDETLAWMRLKPMPPRSRGLAERIAGARRLVYWQRLAAGTFMLALGFAILTSTWRGS